VTTAAPPRSVLSMPADDPAKTAKMASSRADLVILDLEDSVAPAGKPAALDSAIQLIEAAGRADGPTLAVRINALGSPWVADELHRLGATAAPLTIVVPKVESAGDLTAVGDLLRRTTSSPAVQLLALIESARGVAAINEIAGFGGYLSGLIPGYADLAAALGRPIAGDPYRWLPIQDAIVVAARANDIVAIDGPKLSVADDEEFVEAAQWARSLGFDGKWVIHPRQIDTVNGVFSPSPEEVAHAREVIDQLAAAAASGRGAVAWNGQMLDEAVAVAARRVLARAAR
jgi:citrate lyase beta subunit